MDWLLKLISLFAIAELSSTQIDDETEECMKEVQVLFLVDVSNGNHSTFALQQNRLLRTARHLEAALGMQRLKLGLMTFAQSQQLFVELTSSYANDSEKFTETLMSLRSHLSLDTSVAKALRVSAQQFSSFESAKSRKIIVLGHDGISSDLVGETLDSVAILHKLDIELFVVSGNPLASAKALTGYTDNRQKVYLEPKDAGQFMRSLDKLTTCNAIDRLSAYQSRSTLHRVASGVRTIKVHKDKLFDHTFHLGQPCGREVVDLLIVLDTSGSVGRVFEQQRQLAVSILEQFTEASYASGRLRVSVVHFSYSPIVEIPFQVVHPKKELIKMVKETRFTGGSTRIADALDISIEQLEKGKRSNARQVLVLISDGHGMEYWNVVQSTGANLQASGYELFAVSAGVNYNEAELMIYVGDRSRIFVGSRAQEFVPIFTSYIYNCISEHKLSDHHKVNQIGNSIPTRNVANVLPIEDFFQKRKLSESIEPAAKIFPIPIATRKIASSVSNTLPQTDSTTTSTATTSSTSSSTQTFTSSATSTASESITPTSTVRMKSRSLQQQLTAKQSIAEELQRKAQLQFSEDKEVVFDSEQSRPVSESSERDIPQPDELKESCDVDLIMLIDRSQSVEEEFEREILTAKRIVEVFPKNLYTNGSIRFGIISFAWDAKIELNLQTNLPSTITEKLSSIYHSGGTTSTVAGAIAAIKSLYPRRRPSARLLVLIFSDGYSQDYWRDLLSTADELRRPDACTVLAYTASNSFSKIELTAWTGGKPNSIYARERDAEFLERVQQEVLQCDWSSENTSSNNTSLAVIRQTSTESPVVQLETEFQLITPARIFNKLKQSTLEVKTVDRQVTLARAATVPEKLTTTTEKPLVLSINTENKTEKNIKDTEEIKRNDKDNEIESLSALNDISEEVMIREGSGEGSGEIADDNPTTNLGINSASGINCKLDVVLIIDISTSVEKEFDKDIKYAIDLVESLPSHDFENQIRVSIITFHSQSELVHSLDTKTSKAEILKILKSQVNTGGSTSLVSGVGTAIQNSLKFRRKDAKLLTALISDGNSQDHWDNVLKMSKELHDQKGSIYAVSANKKTIKRELEMYAGTLERVYTDGKLNQFLPDVKKEFTTACESSTLSATESDKPSRSVNPVIENLPSCDELIDLIIIADRSRSEFNEADRQLVIKLINSFPQDLFNKRLSVSLIEYSKSAVSRLALGIYGKGIVLEALTRMRQRDGEPSLAIAVNETLQQIERRRTNSNLYVLIISDGSSQDDWQEAQLAAKTLHATDARVFTVTKSDKFYIDELKEYAGDVSRVYTANRTASFVEEVGDAILSCRKNEFKKQAPLIKNSEFPTPSPQLEKSLDPPKDRKLREDENSIVRVEQTSVPCRSNKIDLQIILDASSSRENVFEMQRQLALELIERLPISAQNTHVAVGLNSYTSTPTLRQTLGLGRDKTIVRSVLEGIDYRGGSTRTALAVELSLQDLERGKRKDATQVVILMNDGFSQDDWQTVKHVSDKLKATGAEIFGVALGKDIDMRELGLYVPRADRLYRDGQTKQFLNDITNLLGDSSDCTESTNVNDVENPIEMSMKTMNEGCEADDLDLMVVFDNSDKTDDMSNPAVNMNRYLLLDVLGSLSKHLSNQPARVRVSVVAVVGKGKPVVELDFTDISERDRIFAEIESIKAVSGKVSYSDAVMVGLNQFMKSGSNSSRQALLIVGPGHSDDSMKKTLTAASRIRHTDNLSCLAVDTSSNTNSRYLNTLTGSPKTVFDYDGNIEFAQKLHQIAFTSNKPECLKKEAEISNASFLSRSFKAETINSNTSGGILLDSSVSKSEEEDEVLRVRDARRFETVANTQRLEQNQPHDEVYLIPPTDLKQRDVPSLPSVPPKYSESGIILTKEYDIDEEISENKDLKLQSPNDVVESSTKSTLAKLRLPFVTASSKFIQNAINITLGMRLPLPTKAARFIPLSSTRAPSPTRIISAFASTTSPFRRRHQTKRATEQTTTRNSNRKATRMPVINNRSEPYEPGCMLDVLFVLDTSSNDSTVFNRQKQMASDMIDQLRIGNNNAKVSIIKFTSKDKVKTIHTFADEQSKERVTRALQEMQITPSGKSAGKIDLMKAVTEYCEARGARPGRAKSVAVVLTDGTMEQGVAKEAAKLKNHIRETYTISMDEHKISRRELEKAVGCSKRVFSHSDLEAFHKRYNDFTSDCVPN